MNTIFYHKPASKALSEFDVHESLNLILRTQSLISRFVNLVSTKLHVALDKLHITKYMFEVFTSVHIFTGFEFGMQ